MWSEKVEAILGSEKYETLTVDKLFSKLKSSEVDHEVRQCAQRSRTRLTLIVWLSYLVQGLIVGVLDRQPTKRSIQSR
jgi:hypothetical protein